MFNLINLDEWCRFAIHLSTICQINHGGHYYRFWKAEYQAKITYKP
jgi:hypothetical protein